MLSFIFFHMTQAFANFTSIKYDELYTLAIIVEKLYFIGGIWLPELTKHKRISHCKPSRSEMIESSFWGIMLHHMKY